MPQSLWDMFQPQNAAGEPTGFGDAVTSRSNSLIGLGLGLLSPSNPLRGQSSWGQGLEGFQGGAQIDARTAVAAAARRQHAADQARAASQHAADRAQAQSNFERQFERSDPANTPTDFTRAARDQGLKPGTPEYNQYAKEFYAPKTEQPAIVWQEDADGNKIPYLQNPRNTANPITRLPIPDGTATGADPFTTGAAPPVYGLGQGGFSATPQAQSGATAPPTVPNRGITLPSGEVVTPPPGLSKKGREAWQNHIASTAADMASGKMTEAQAKYSIYATGMEIAQRELHGLEGAATSPGTSAEGKGLGRLPWGVGAYFQSNEYQNYRNAKDAWLNAKLRAESGATINPDEFARDDRIYFPQPGEGPEQVAAKKVLRDQITKNMTRAGGPGYTSPPPLAPPMSKTPTGPAPATAGGGATFNERFTGGGPGGGLPPPPAGFKIVQP